ncbi:MAG: hypothetical protein RIQ90_1525 [Bacteroidota bacterium]|jgi:hypothetical protein
MKTTVILFLSLISLLTSSVHGQIIKTWKIDSLQVELIRIEQARVDVGIHHHTPPSFFTMFEIKKNDLPIKIGGGGIDVSKDSCVLSFLELPKNRVKNGIVGHTYKINLCNSEISSQKVIKPQWTISAIDSMTITPLDSLIYNQYNPWQPIVVPHYNLGKQVKLHPKMIEGFFLFFNDAYLTASFKPTDFLKPYNPTFEFILYMGEKSVSVNYYWGRFLVDGFIYGGGSAFGGGSGSDELKFWEANLKLINQK